MFAEDVITRELRFSSDDKKASGEADEVIKYMREQKPLKFGDKEYIIVSCEISVARDIVSFSYKMMRYG